MSERVIVRDRLRARRLANSAWNQKVKNKAVSDSEVKAEPGKFYPQWFNPNRERLLPLSVDRSQYERMRRELRDVHGGLDIVWHPLRECWQVYIRNDNVQSWWTKGWERIVMFEPWGTDSLVRRIKAKLYFMKPEIFGKARPDGDRVLYEREIAAQKWEDHLDDGARDNAREIYWNQLPKNISHGAKVAEQYE